MVVCGILFGGRQFTRVRETTPEYLFTFFLFYFFLPKSITDVVVDRSKRTHTHINERIHGFKITTTTYKQTKPQQINININVLCMLFYWQTL